MFFGKQIELSFPKQIQFQASQMFVHFDIKGLLDPTFIGFQIFVIFIDDFNRYTMIYFIKHKSQTFSKFKVENFQGSKINKNCEVTMKENIFKRFYNFLCE